MHMPTLFHGRLAARLGRDALRTLFDRHFSLSPDGWAKRGRCSHHTVYRGIGNRWLRRRLRATLDPQPDKSARRVPVVSR